MIASEVGGVGCRGIAVMDLKTEKRLKRCREKLLCKNRNQQSWNWQSCDIICERRLDSKLNLGMRVFSH